jgi:hypothetical protein
VNLAFAALVGFLTAGWLVKTLAYGLRWNSVLSVVLGVVAGTAVGVVLWFVLGAPAPECVDFTADPSGRC